MSVAEDLDKQKLHTPHHLLKGAFLNLCGWLVATVVVAFIRKAQETTTIPMILFFQGIFGVAFTLPWIIKDRLFQKPKSGFGLIAIRCIAGQTNSIFLYLTVHAISLANGILLNNAAPIFLPFILYIWLRQKIDHRLWPGIILGFCGVYLILEPTAAIFNIGAIYGIIAAIFLAITMISLRLLSYKDKTITVLFYYFLTALIIGLPFCIFQWTMPSKETLFYLLMIGLTSVIAQFFLVSSFRFAKASQLGPFSYSAVVYAALIDWWLWNNGPDLLTITGMILVTLGGIFVIIYSRPPKKET